MVDGEPSCVSVHRLCVSVGWMYSERHLGSAVANPAMACCTKGLAVFVCTVRAQKWAGGR